MANKIIINGRTIRVPSGTIHISGNSITVDGKQVDADELQAPVVNITIPGTKAMVHNISGCDSVVVHGKVMDIETVNGDVKVHGHVHGRVETINGNIRAECFEGDCRTVNGNITGVKNDE